MARTIVTVSNEYGAGGTAVGNRAARLLGYEVVDEQLPFVVAQRLEISQQDAEAAEDTRRSVGERMLAGLERGTPELAIPSLSAALEERYVMEVRNAVLEYAARGRVVILGRGAGAILGKRPDVLRVFLHAPKAWRIEYVAQLHAIDRKTATDEVERVDAARRAYLRDAYKVAFGDPNEYDLGLDTAQLGHELCAALICQAANA